MASTIPFPTQPSLSLLHRHPCRARCLATSTTCDGSAFPLAGIWRHVQGCSDWDGLLLPLHPLVREEVVRYGELVHACYKAFDVDSSSSRYLNCMYGKDRMLAEVGMTRAGYEVTKYIYAAPDVAVPAMQSGRGGGRSRWIGYVALSTDEQTRRLGRRDVLVSFRGTVTPAEWLANFMSTLSPARLDPCDPRPDVRVESGFLGLYTSADRTCRFGGAGSCREQLLREVPRLIDEHSNEDISITLAGHSMGAALALLFGYDLAELGLNRSGSASRHDHIPITVFSFGGPRVGNMRFKARCEELGVKVLRVANVRDPVTKLPGFFLNEGSVGQLGEWSRLSCYAHVGVELALDFFGVGGLARVHDLGTYIEQLKTAEHADKWEGVLARIVGRQGPWQDAAMQVGDLALSLGLL